MDAVRGDISGRRRQKRRWRFGNAEFDEGRWALSVGGQPVALETKPLELLRVLLLRAGEAVSKDELLDAVWPDVAVVEASLPTAIAKLRRALGDTDKEVPIIETVARIGYRLAVRVEETGESAPALAMNEAPMPQRAWKLWPWGIAAGAALLIAGLFLFQQPWLNRAGIAVAGAPQREAVSAIRSLDVAAIDAMLREGWDPNIAFDTEGNAALGTLVQICEWDPAHDRQKLLLAARKLIDGGALYHSRNKWGDTPYSIARAERYCGADHPVTRMMHSLCYAGTDAPRDDCLADYASARTKD